MPSLFTLDKEFLFVRGSLIGFVLQSLLKRVWLDSCLIALEHWGFRVWSSLREAALQPPALIPKVLPPRLWLWEAL